MNEWSEWRDSAPDAQEFCDTTDETNWDGFDSPDIPEPANCELDERTEADKAADYARSFGFDKAGDYISRHFDGEQFDPDRPIPITTRNMDFAGAAPNGVPFERRTAELTDGLCVEGVFPSFDSLHHVELGQRANDMSLHEQFSACREDLQEHLFDSDHFELRDISFGQFERMDAPQGYAPEGYTWQHNPETGSLGLVRRDDHAAAGHTGGNALWGKSM